jgi:hypothetical protein
MTVSKIRNICFAVLLSALPPALVAQSQNSSLSGTVTDTSGAVMANVNLTLTSLERQSVAKAVSSTAGLYTFPNLEPGNYELEARASGFRPFIQKGISLSIGQSVHVDLKLEVGSDVQSIEVTGNASTLNFDNAVKQEGIGPETLNELPLIVAGGPRNSAQFAVLMPGVSTGGGNSAFDARINGGLQSGDEAIMDGVSMQEGTMSQSGMVAFADFRLTPDMVSEFKVLTSSYEPEYGASTGAQLIATTKSGTSEYHGGGLEYLRNKSLNATQFQVNRKPGDQRPKDNEHEFGGFLGGPLTIPFINRHNRWRTFFFTDIEFFRIAGGASRPTLSIPSLKERNGDFTDWIDSSTGQLIPILDPATTRLNPGYNPNLKSGPNNQRYLRDQFSCNGVLNVICPNRFASSAALQYFKFLPQPTSGGALNNYLVPTPVPDSILAGANHYLGKLDQYFGQNDHVAITIWRQTTPAKFLSVLPLQLATESFSAPQDSWVNRLNWDHTFSPTLLNHFATGYLNRNEGYGSVDTKYAADLVQVPGVASHNYPPAMSFSDGFHGFGDSSGVNTGNITTRPSYVTNDLITWVRGKHTIKFGGEIRKLGQNFHSNGNESGSFGFSRSSTGVAEFPSGSPIASFLLGAVDNASASFRTVSSWYSRQSAYVLHAGDTWKVRPKLSLNYGLRWDTFTPSVEKYDRLSFFDFGPNPAAGNRLGRLAFAGTKYGTASAGVDHPEKTWQGGFAPRIGIAYALNDKTVVRTGYGIFYTEAFYPGWGGGQSQAGFNANPSFSSTLGGIQPAFYLQDGLPQNFTKPPQINPGAQNGQGILYRPKDANRRSYSQQWNFTVERQLGADTQLSAAYVGSKGTRLPSQLDPLNVLNPSLLSLGAKLNDQFGPNDTVKDGVTIPYPGWVQQMTGCAPSVAQALLPYPQYCDSLTGENENLGSSTYHSLQLKAERRYAQSLYLLAAFTHSKLLTDVGGNTQSGAGTWNGQTGVISPFERHRNKGLAADDVPNVFSLAVVYQLPFGRGKHFLNSGGFVDKVFGGWETSINYRASSGTPLFFRSGTCNVPGQFRVACIPALVGKSPFLQDKGSFDPSKPLFDKNAFEPATDFNFFYGTGPRITTYRGFGFRNLDFVLTKNISITERLKLQIRGEAFNALNEHHFTGGGFAGDSIPFNHDIASSSFGVWNGGVTTPRNIQLVGRLTF